MTMFIMLVCQRHAASMMGGMMLSDAPALWVAARWQLHSWAAYRSSPRADLRVAVLYHLVNMSPIWSR